MPPAGFEPAIPTSEQPQTDVLDCAPTQIVMLFTNTPKFHVTVSQCYVFTKKDMVCIRRQVSHTLHASTAGCCEGGHYRQGCVPCSVNVNAEIQFRSIVLHL